jgi:hypothetical protein
MWKAYKQVPAAKEQMNCMIIQLWDIVEKRWTFCKSHVLAFGLSGAVLHFNRVPTFLIAFCRRFFSICVTGFFDDHRIVEFTSAGSASFRWFKRVSDWLGLRFDPKKDQIGMGRLPLLGNIERYDMARSDKFVVEARSDRLEDIRTSIISFLNLKRLKSGEAATLRGRMMHVGQCRPGRLGRATLTAVSRIADGHADNWSFQLEWDLHFALDSLRQHHAKTYPLADMRLRRVTGFSDASYEPREGKPFMRIAALVSDGSISEGVVADIEWDIIDVLIERQTQILVAELLGFMALLIFYGERLRATSFVAFNDNMAVVYAIINGTARVKDIGSLVTNP